MDEKIAELKKLVDSSNRIVFFGGAGVSTESGIPDFRSEDGLYHQKFKYPPEMMLSHSFYVGHKKEFYEFYREKMLCLDAKPNVVHKRLAELEAEGKLIAVVTQKFTGKYYVDEELLIHADITEEISYKPRPGSNYGADGNRELMADMKDEFPSPVVQHHCVCDLTSYGGGTYVLSVQESGKETEFYDGILK